MAPRVSFIRWMVGNDENRPNCGDSGLLQRRQDFFCEVPAMWSNATRSILSTLAGAMGLTILGPAVRAQSPDSPPETIQTPPAQSAPATNPEPSLPVPPLASLPSYGGAQAAADSYRYAEQQRREAIGSQMALNDQLSSHHWHTAYPYNYYARFWVAPPAHYGYSRAYRGIGISVAGAGYGVGLSSYLGPPPRPLGYVETWLGPNRYSYRPLDGQSGATPPAFSAPSLATGSVPSAPPAPKPETVPSSPPPQVAGPVVQPTGGPEALPAPPPESGPREF